MVHTYYTEEGQRAEMCTQAVTVIAPATAVPGQELKKSGPPAGGTDATRLIPVPLRARLMYPLRAPSSCSWGHPAGCTLGETLSRDAHTISTDCRSHLSRQCEGHGAHRDGPAARSFPVI